MKTVKENATQLMQDLLRRKTSMPQDKTEKFASQLVDLMGYAGKAGDELGEPNIVVLTTSKLITSLFYRPVGTKIVWFQMDDLDHDGLDAVEVF